MRFQHPLPREAYRLNPETLRRRCAALAAAHKSTAILSRKLVLSTCAKLRRETKEHA